MAMSDLVAAEIDQLSADTVEGHLDPSHSRRHLGGDAVHRSMVSRETDDSFLHAGHTRPRRRCIPGARSGGLFLSGACSHPPSRKPQILSGVATRYRVSRCLAKDRHQARRLMRDRDGQELLSMAAPIHIGRGYVERPAESFDVYEPKVIIDRHVTPAPRTGIHRTEVAGCVTPEWETLEPTYSPKPYFVGNRLDITYIARIARTAKPLTSPPRYTLNGRNSIRTVFGPAGTSTPRNA